MGMQKPPINVFIFYNSFCCTVPDSRMNLFFVYFGILTDILNKGNFYEEFPILCGEIAERREIMNISNVVWNTFNLYSTTDRTIGAQKGMQGKELSNVFSELEEEQGAYMRIENEPSEPDRFIRAFGWMQKKLREEAGQEDHWLLVQEETEEEISSSEEEGLETLFDKYVEESKQTVDGCGLYAGISIDANGIRCTDGDGNIVWEIPLKGYAQYKKCVGLMHRLAGMMDCSFINSESFWKDFLDGKIGGEDAVRYARQHS